MTVATLMEIKGVSSVEENKKSSQVVGATSEDNVETKKIKTTKKVRTLFQPLMAVVLSVNLIVVTYVVITNQNMKQVNEEISELNETRKKLNLRQEILFERQEELFEQQAEELERRKEIDNTITKILNRHQQEAGR